MLNPAREIQRLHALRSLGVLRVSPDEGLADLCDLAAQICGAPMAVITLVDERREVIKAAVGMPMGEQLRELGFAGHAILTPDQVLMVEDARADPRFSSLPLVTGQEQVRTWAGSPLLAAPGLAVGVLAVMDRAARHFSAWQLRAIQTLGRQAMRLFAAAASESVTAVTARESVDPGSGSSRIVAAAAIGGAVYVDGDRISFNSDVERMIGWSCAELPTVDSWFRTLFSDEAGRRRSAYEADRQAGFPGARTLSVTIRDGTQRMIEFAAYRSERGEVWLLRDVTDLAASRSALVGGEARFRTICEASPLGVYVTAADGDCIYANARWGEISGWPSETALGREWVKTIHPEDRERLVAAWQEAVASGMPLLIEFRMQRRDGRVIWVRAQTAPMREERRLTGFVGSLEDITASRDLVEQLQRASARFALAARGAGFGLVEVILDPDHWEENIGDAGYPVSWSPEARALLGYTVEEFPDRAGAWFGVVHPQDITRVIAGFSEHLRSAASFSMDVRMRVKDGSFRWFSASGETERDGLGRPMRFAASFTDITARKQEEERAGHARSQLIDAIESLDSGFAMYDREELLVACNDKYREFYAPAVRVIKSGVAYITILRELCRQGAHRHTGLSEEAWIDGRLAEHRNPGPDRETRIAGAWLRISDRRTSDGGIVSLHTDITALMEGGEELRRSKETAEAAVKARSEFLATMSHEIRTPMNGVIGMTSLLLDTKLDDQQRNFAVTVKTCGDALLTLINDILDFSKIEAGKLDLEAIPFSPRRLVEDAAAMVAERAQSKGIDLCCLASAILPASLIGDPARLRQVVLNLLSNAVKFTERGEVVASLATESTVGGKTVLVLAVRDSGIGIPLDARHRLFTVFTQADGSTTRKYGGSGLGLVICKRLIELMGGTITVDSEQGRGSCFTCRVPLPVSAQQDDLRVDAEMVGKRVLCVDAHPASRRGIREQVIAWGMLCDEAVDGAAASSLMRSAPPDLLLVDDALADVMVMTLAREAQGGGQRPLIPVVLLVGAGHRGLAAQARDAGISGLLSKPVRQDQLYECMMVLFHRSCPIGDRPALVTRHSLADNRADGRRILVVEDSVVNQKVTSGMLAKLGLRCDIAANGREGVEAVARVAYDVVLMDCQMPVLDGYAATAEIRIAEKGESRARVRIIALTANAMVGDRERCLAAGMDDFITKPITLETLANALDRARAPVAAPVVPAAPAVVDQVPDAADFSRAALDDLLQATDRETVAAVTALMMADAPGLVDELRRAAEANDAVALARTAHRFKGSAGTMGLLRIQELCQQIEQRARSRDLAGAVALVPVLQAAVGRGLVALGAAVV